MVTTRFTRRRYLVTLRDVPGSSQLTFLIGDENSDSRQLLAKTLARKIPEAVLPEAFLNYDKWLMIGPVARNVLAVRVKALRDNTVISGDEIAASPL